MVSDFAEGILNLNIGSVDVVFDRPCCFIEESSGEDSIDG